DEASLVYSAPPENRLNQDPADVSWQELAACVQANAEFFSSCISREQAVPVSKFAEARRFFVCHQLLEATQELAGAMSIEGSCHCGKVRISVPARPDWVAQCNRSLCRKLAWRVAYYPPDEVRISGQTTAYVWG